MERVLFLSPRKLESIEPSGWQRLYVGNEFCERLMPDDDYIKRVRDEKGADMPVSLVTPYLTDAGLNKVMDIIERFAVSEPLFDEVVINDWGLLRKTRGLKLTRILGRLLIRQLRDPRIIRWKRTTPDRFLRVDDLSVNDEFVSFLLTEGIGRVELDTVPEDISVLAGRLKLSLYRSFTYITTTRLCPVANLAARDRFVLYVPKTCGFECIGRGYALDDEVMGERIYLFGNAMFFRNDATAGDEPPPVFDRIVYQQLP